jgi:hypothetical protein
MVIVVNASARVDRSIEYNVSVSGATSDGWRLLVLSC